MLHPHTSPTRLPRSLLCALLLAALPLAAAPAKGPLHLDGDHPLYFSDADGHPVYLAGGHDGWELQDYCWGDKNAGVKFDWQGFLKYLRSHHHNVFRLWSVEHTKIVDSDKDLTVPMPYLRVVGHGQANDGGDKFDLDRFNEPYFQRLRLRAHQAGAAGIYTIVMLFQGWSIEDKGGRVNPWPYHPFHASNNVNGVNADLNGDGAGRELHSWLGAEHPLTKRQRAYVRKVIQSVNDLDNVLYEIANESDSDSLEWQSRMVAFIHQEEKARAKQHPVGITVPFGGRNHPGLNAELFATAADWISPNREARGGFNYREDPPPADGRKIVLSDTDHLFGDQCRDYTWVWKTFCRGHNLLYMDKWTLEPDDPKRELVRRALGHTRDFSEQMNLLAARPRNDLSSTRYCLADPDRSYLVYAPAGGSFTLDLSDAPSEFAVAWFNPRTAAKQEGHSVPGNAIRTMKTPFPGDAVLFLRKQ